MVSVMPDRIMGSDPSTDQRTEKQRRDAQQRLADTVGVTEEELRSRPSSFGGRPVYDRVYRIDLPSHFSSGSLPERRTLKLGPSHWSESYAQVDEDTVEVRFHFEIERVDWSAADIQAFRDVYWRYAKEAVDYFTTSFTPRRLLANGKASEAVALGQRLLRETPHDGSTRARLAGLLLEMGLGYVAHSLAPCVTT